MTQKERKLRIVNKIIRLGDVFNLGFGVTLDGKDDNPDDELHGIQTESGIDITTEGGVIIQAENQ